MPETFLVTGNTIKNITLPQYPDDAWDWISKAPDTEFDELYASVAAVYRVANMTADTVANMPFNILNKVGDIVDDSRDWQNKVGFMPNPRNLLRLWRLSLFMTNSAYGFMEGNRINRHLRYIVPSTIEPEVNNRDGLVGFYRKIGNKRTFYSLDDNRIFYMWKLDHTTELLPSEHSEFKAAMAAAGIIYYSDFFIRNFFERGGIKPTMLMVKGVPDKETREKIESVWDRVVRGGSKFLGKIFNAEAIEPKVIGDGIDNLKDNQLHAAKIEDIAIATGIPLSLLKANSANFATAEVERMTWFRDKVIPDVHFMEDVMNEQLFRPMGYHIEFKPEMTNMGTEEERERAGAFSALVASNVKPSRAAQILGYDLPDDMEYSDLDDDFLFMLNEKAKASQSDAPSIGVPKPPRDRVPAESAPKSEPTYLTIDQLRELELWQSFAFRKLKRGESLDFPFVCKSLPEHVATGIREQLPACRTKADIERAFQMTGKDDDPLKELADALNKAAEKMEIAE